MAARGGCCCRRRLAREPSIVGEPDAAGDAVYLADETALLRIAVDGDPRSTRSSATGTTTLGTPAQPIVHDGEVFAAWLPSGDEEGVLWSSPGRVDRTRLRRRDPR